MRFHPPSHPLLHTRHNPRIKAVTHLIGFPLRVGNRRPEPTVMNVAVWAEPSQTCGRQTFDKATLLLWLVCSRVELETCKETPRGSGFSWGDVEGREDEEAASRWASLAERRHQRKTQRGRGRGWAGATLNISLFLSFYLLLFSFFKAFSPGRSEKDQPTYTRWTWADLNPGWKHRQHVKPQEDLVYVIPGLVSKCFPLHLRLGVYDEGGLYNVMEANVREHLQQEGAWGFLQINHQINRTADFSVGVIIYLF